MINDVCIVEKIDMDFDEVKILKHFARRTNTAILDSALKSEDTGRFTIISYDPFMVFTAKGNQSIARYRDGNEKIVYGNPLEILRGFLKEYRTSWKNSEIPFTGGCAGYFSYDLANLIEELPDKNTDDIGVDDILLGFYNKTVVIDHRKREVHAVGNSCGCVGDKQHLARGNINQVKKELERIKCPEHNEEEINSAEASIENTEPGSNFIKEDYIEMVDRAREYIRNGDIFQVNLSQRFKVQINREPYTIYFSLREQSPAPFSAFIDFGDVKIISSSPERFIKIEGSRIETRPIKGTRPRGRNIDEDIRNKNELLASEKDRAELTMIVDLERNDLGKVCKIGSIKVERHAVIEEYSNVFHTVSVVSGDLRDGVDVIDCICAAFPGGSITGAPKVRAMEIIEELEPVKRNIYTGSIGYIGFNGETDLNIAIRTIVVKGNYAYYSVGGGIVWDSSPENEYMETLYKGQKMMDVLRRSV